MANEIKSAIDSAFRDFVTDGVPSSGINKPSKSEIRTAGQTIQTQVDTKATVVSVDALTDRVDEIEATATAGVKWTTYLVEGRSTGNVNLASGLENGDTLNGLTVQTGKHYFLGLQTDPAQNGIYTAVASGAASRATFADSAAELAYIGFVLQGGTVGTGERWTLPLAAADITVGTTALNFAPQGVEPGYAAEVAAARGGEASLSDAMALKAPLTVTDALQAEIDAVEDSIALVDAYETLDTTALGATTVGFDEDENLRRITAETSEGTESESFITLNGIVYGDYETLDADLPAGIIMLGLDEDGVLRRVVSSEVSLLPVEGAQYLYAVRSKMRTILSGSTAQLRVAVIADSFLYATTRTTGVITADLVSYLGNAGPGYITLAPLNLGAMPTSVGFPNANSTGYTVALTGGWAPSYFSAVPSIATIDTTSTAKATISGAATPVLSAAVLHYIATADGAAQYRWNAGSWHSLDLTGSGADTISLATDMPVSGAWTLEIEWVSGSVKLGGVQMESAGAGVRVDKLAQPGSNIAQWVSVNEAQFAAGLASLDPDLILIMHGTNSQNSHSPTVFSGYMATMIARCIAAVPTSAVLVAMPPENMRLDNTYSMASLAYPVRLACRAAKAAFIDEDYYFPQTPEEKGSTGLLYFDETVDETHPTVWPAGPGGIAMADPILRLLKYSI